MIAARFAVAALVLVLVLGAGGASAQEVPLRPGLDRCMADAMGRFERSLRRNPGPARPDMALLSQHDVLVCGGIGIQTCDLRDDRIACQADLTADHAALTAQVLASLPAPEGLAAPVSHWSAQLYPRLYEIAHGRSAGPDCAGDDALRAAWCEAVEANRQLASAVMTYQLARLLDAVPSAVDAGWALPARPPVPVRRPQN